MYDGDFYCDGDAWGDFEKVSKNPSSQMVKMSVFRDIKDTGRKKQAGESLGVDFICEILYLYKV